MAGNADDAISRLKAALGAETVSAREQERLAKDIERVTARLLQGEYASKDFTANTFNVPERTREFYDNLHGYFEYVATWEKVFAAIEIGSVAHVVDLCSGWAPKLPLSLWYAGYAGKLTLVDKCQESMESLKRFMQLFRPRFEIHACNTDLLRDTPRITGDLVVGNHIADDFALELAQSRFDFNTVELYEVEGAYQAVWDRILADPETLADETASRLADITAATVAPAGKVIFTQYRAYMERLLGLDAVVEFGRVIIDGTIKTLTARGFTERRQPVSAALAGHSGVFSAGECWLLVRA